MDEHGEDILRLLAIHRRPEIEAGMKMLPQMEEIRIRIGQPVLMRQKGKDYWFHPYEKRIEPFLERRRWNREGIVEEKELREMLSYITRYSLYAYEEELRQGFVTVQGGHRIGVAGQMLQKEDEIRGMLHISSLNIRIAREVWHCADEILPYLWKGEEQLHHTIFVSPPGCGKTTVLRECIRMLSYGTTAHSGQKIGVVDERSELAACYRGIPQNDLGPRTDVLDGCKKSEGIRMLLRSMSPQIIAVDELGGEEDFQALREAFTCGCSLIGTLHGKTFSDVCRQHWMLRWRRENWLERIVVLGYDMQNRRTYQIYQADGEILGGGFF